MEGGRWKPLDEADLRVRGEPWKWTRWKPSGPSGQCTPRQRRLSPPVGSRRIRRIRSNVATRFCVRAHKSGRVRVRKSAGA
eukprot:6672297-Pyramimonas_sp.AAC.1